MNLNTFFQISVSIFSIVATLFIVALFILAIMFRLQLNRLIAKLNEISEIAKSTAGNTKDFVDRTINSLEVFKNSIFTFDFICQIIGGIIEIIKNKERNKNG